MAPARASEQREEYGGNRRQGVGPFERTLTVQLEEAELEAAKNKAARKLAGEMKIKGFRPGKAPRSIVERMVGEETLRSEAIEEAIPGVVGDALEESDLEPVTVPRVSDIRDADEGFIEVDVLITLWPTLDAVPDFSDREIAIDVACRRRDVTSSSRSTRCGTSPPRSRRPPGPPPRATS